MRGRLQAKRLSLFAPKGNGVGLLCSLAPFTRFFQFQGLPLKPFLNTLDQTILLKPL